MYSGIHQCFTVGAIFPRMILDNGCQRNVAGARWHRETRKRLRETGLAPVKIDQTEDFQFGDDRIDTSVCAWEYPIGIRGNNGSLNIAEVSSNCPGLMSQDTMADLDIDIRTRSRTYN